MSVRGIKRPLSDRDEQNSPEYLTRLQPVRDSEDEISPECVLSVQPVTDPYSSDDSSQQKQHNKTCKRDCNYKEDRDGPVSVILPNPSCSSHITAEQVLFFFDIDYIPQKQQVNLADLSVEDILSNLLDFAFADIKNEHLRNKSTSELLSETLAEKSNLSWMMTHDKLDILDASKADKRDCVKIFNEEARKCGEDVKLIKNLLVRLHVDDLTSRSCEGWRGDLYRAANALAIDLRYSGEVSHRLDYDIPVDLATDSCGVFQTRYLSITVRPDVVLLDQQGLQEIAVQVYTPTGDILQMQTDDIDPTDSIVQKPDRKLNGILSTSYRTQAERYIRRSLPPECHDTDCMNNIAGQHLLQLLSLADCRSRQVHFSSCHVVGLFMIKNHIYFSKMCVFADRLKLITRSCESYFQNADVKPKVTFSNWHLDITRAKHRMALLVFLHVYLKYKNIDL